MREINAPPPVLDMARVIAYAFVDKSVTWTGRQVLYVDGELLGQVPRLALCQNLSASLTDILLFHCDDEWQVLGSSVGATLEAAMDQAELAYRGISSIWIHTDISVEEADQWIRSNHPDAVCAFCDKLATETDGMFYAGRAAICYSCVSNLHPAIQNNADAV